MNSRKNFLGLAAVSALLMSATGCVCVSSGGNRSGDVTFKWTFGGRSCLGVPGVTKVKVTIPGQSLQNQGVYACNTAGTDGIKLLNFRAGTYNFTVLGLSDANVEFYAASGSFVVNGDIETTVDLAPVTGAPSYVYVSWSFPPNSVSATPNCAQTTMRDVVITLDGDARTTQRVACTAGFGTVGVPLTTTAGVHTIDIAATDGGLYYYRKITQLPALVAGASISADYRLDWYVGSLPLRWSINTTVVSTCRLQNIDRVRIDLMDSQNQYPYGQNGVEVNCSEGGVQGTLFQYLHPDTYRVFIQATRTTDGWQYRSNFTTPPSFLVTSGQFPVLDSNTPQIAVTQCSTRTCQ